MNRTFSIRIFFIYWLPVILCCTAIFIQSSYPVSEQLPAFPFADKLLHAVAYALLGFLFFRAFRMTTVHKRTFLLVILSAVASSLYGVGDEIHQHFVPSRTADILDMAADAIGGSLGAFVAWLVWKR